jgi:hypothetical protein
MPDLGAAQAAQELTGEGEVDLDADQLLEAAAHEEAPVDEEEVEVPRAGWYTGHVASRADGVCRAPGR